MAYSCSSSMNEGIKAHQLRRRHRYFLQLFFNQRQHEGTQRTEKGLCAGLKRIETILLLGGIGAGFASQVIINTFSLCDRPVSQLEKPAHRRR